MAWSAAKTALRRGLVLAGFTELDVRVTFLRQVQVNHGRGDISQVIAAIQRQLNFTQRAVATLTDS